ncbi:MAG: hypothetical protein IJ001_08585 [Oscillospiraceae bacterium]|nr:hypothetical protein [Oscillospiraceae bacterium]
MSDSLQNRIVNLIPSEDLRNVIKSTAYQLTDIALLSTVYYCAPDFASRIEYLQMLEAVFTGEIKAYITRIIETQHQMLDAFLRNETGVAFELHIKETPDAYDETYLCSSFDAAVKMIPLFYQEYDSNETALSRYRIVKRRIFSAQEGELFFEDYLGEAVLLPGEIIHSVEMNGYCAENCDGLCLDCERYCVRRQDVLYPVFAGHADAVKYREHDGSVGFGVVLQWDDAPTNECYIIPLDCEQVRYHDFKNAHYAHEHVPSVFVERISVDRLSDKMQKDYLAYSAFLKENPAWT